MRDIKVSRSDIPELVSNMRGRRGKVIKRSVYIYANPPLPLPPSIIVTGPVYV